MKNVQSIIGYIGIPKVLTHECLAIGLEPQNFVNKSNNRQSRFLIQNFCQDSEKIGKAENKKESLIISLSTGVLWRQGHRLENLLDLRDINSELLGNLVDIHGPTVIIGLALMQENDVS